MNLELAAIIAVLVVVLATTIAPRLGVATPVLLVGLGLGLSMLPWLDSIVVNPEWILAGVLPPLLYSAAVNTPVIEFRRDFGLISAFSVVLVVVSAVLIGLLAVWMVPGLPLGLGIALGAIVSPTDAVATSIVAKAGVSGRLVTVLQGESMLNDASALVLLRVSVAAVGVSVSMWQVLGTFVWTVVAAVAIGWLVGRANLLVRRWVREVPAGVALSLAVPFLAYLPTEHLGASGLVAAVTAGLVTGYGAPHKLSAEERIAERAVWRTIELLLESAVFLLVGLELPALVSSLSDDGSQLAHPLELAAVVVLVAMAIRAAFVTFAVWALARRNRRSAAVRAQLSDLHDQLSDGQLPAAARLRPGRSTVDHQRRVGRWQHLVQRRLADVDYLASEQFGWRDGVVLVWAGMRGAVTIAAAQTLPAETLHRPLIVLSATAVAVGTLVIQGLTLEPLARRLGVSGDHTGPDPQLWQQLSAELDQAGLAALPSEYSADLVTQVRARLGWAGQNESDGSPVPEMRAKVRRLRLDALDQQRTRLLELRAVGSYPSEMLDDALAQLDAEQISIELRQQYD